LVDRRLEQVSHWKAPVDEVMERMSTYRRRLEREAFLHGVSQGWRDAQLHLGEESAAGSGSGSQGPGPWGPSEAAGECTVAGVDDSPG